MLEDWSGGYYRSRMKVQEYDDGPAIERGLYDFINRELYVDTNSPVMMRLGLDADECFNVKAENAIPRDVLALPQDFFNQSGMRNVFVLKSQYANTVGEYHG